MTSISISWSGIQTNNTQIQAPPLARSGSPHASAIEMANAAIKMQLAQEELPLPTACSYASCTLIATSATPTVPSHSCSILISDGACTCILVVM